MCRDHLRAAFLVALLASCRGRGPEPEAESGPRTVHCAAAESGEVAETLELRGTVAPLPDQDALIAPQVPGRIQRVLVREGDSVSVGQPVARIDDALLVDQAREAEAALAKTLAEVRNADATLARTHRVFEHGIAARQEVDDATARLDTARAAESQATAGARLARRQVERATVRSPLSGVVVRILRRSGELVDGTPATPVVEVADPSRLELVSDAPAPDLVRVQKGMPAAVTIAALPGRRWAGAVAAVSPAVDRTTGLGVVRVGLSLVPGVRPPIGLLGTASIQVGKPRAATLIPTQALRSGVGAEAEAIVCGGDGLAHVVRVRRGAAVGPRTAVEGISPGQRVAIEPVIGIADGEKIEAVR